MDKNKEKSDSYGMIRISRSHGSAHGLFGSSIKHNDTVHIQISNGSVTRELHCDWYAEEGKIIDLELSATQFADVITGIGSAVPCTITWERGKGPIPFPEYRNKKEEFRDEFQQIVDDSSEKSEALISSVKEIFAKKTITKGDKEEVIRSLNSLSGLVRDHAKYIATCFDEQMERSVAESKGEIEAFWQKKLNDIAFSSLSVNVSSKSPVLLDDQNEEE